MKRTGIFIVLIGLTASLMFTGFQCGTAEMTSAKLYIQRSEWDNAKVQLQKELEKHPENAEAWYMLGRVYHEQKSYKEMVDAFNNSLKINQQFKKEIDSYKFSVWASSLNKGVENYNRAIQSDKDVAPEFFNAAIENLKTSISTMPDSFYSYKILSFVYVGIKQKDSAVIYLKEALKRQNDYQLGLSLGRIYYEYANSAKENKNQANTYYSSAIDIFTKSQEWGEKELERSIENKLKVGMTEKEVRNLLGEPDKINSITDAQGMLQQFVYGKHNLYVHINNLLVESWVEIDKSTHSLSDYLNEIQTLLLNSYIESGRIEEAIESYKKAVIKNPENKLVHYNYGVLLLRTGNLSVSVEQFEKSIELDNNFTDAIYNAAAAYMQWGAKMREQAEAAIQNDKTKQIDKAFEEKFKKAKYYLDRLVTLTPNDISAWETLGMANAILNIPKEAKAAYDKADILRNFGISIGMSEEEVIKVHGNPQSKVETVYETLKATQWNYDNKELFLYFVDGKLKGWTRFSK